MEISAIAAAQPEFINIFKIILILVTANFSSYLNELLTTEFSTIT
ncbi:hypothetical protein LTSEGIV_2284 [Salmonella enterica subsp. enterica serovar Give str. S5-487]|nr:hypothetical protein LTSEGIV_2284 [Salmonella enterica subsp. enterica serovar Give str. S5-487]